MNPRAAPASLDEAVPRALLRLGLPILGMHALRLAYQWVDALWVRGLGVEATAAVTTSVFILWAVVALNDVIAIGVTSFVSQLLGAGERDRAGDLVRRALGASVAIGLAIALAGVPLASHIAAFMDPEGAVTASSTAYLRVLFLGAVFPLFISTAENVMRAGGNTRVSLSIDLSAVLLNALLDPLLIYGAGPFPRLGVAGAAWATLASQALGAGAYLVVALRGHGAFPLGRDARGPRVRLSALARVGTPVALIGVLFAVVYAAFARAASVAGAAGVAVVGIVNRVEAIQFVLGTAIGWAGGALLGQALGAGRIDRAELVLRTGMRWMLALSAVLMAAYLAVPGAFLGMFTQDPEVLRLGVPYMRILALAALATGAEVVTEGILVGSGHTRVLSLIFTVVSLIRIPLAFLVPAWTGSGLVGIAWVIAGTCIVRASFIVGWAARGTWKSGLSRELGLSPPSEVSQP